MGERFTEKWITFPVTADAIIQDHWRVLVARSRDQSINNDYAKRFIKVCKQNIVGHKGVVLQAQSKDANGQIDKLANDAIELEWKKWGKKGVCEVTGMYSWRDMHDFCITSGSKDGEFIVRILRGKKIIHRN